MNDCTKYIAPYFYLLLAAFGVILAMLAMFFGYNLKLSAKQAELKKEIQQVERVNGKEKAEIKDLQTRIKQLEKNNHDYPQ